MKVVREWDGVHEQCLWDQALGSNPSGDRRVGGHGGDQPDARRQKYPEVKETNDV